MLDVRGTGRTVPQGVLSWYCLAGQLTKKLPNSDRRSDFSRRGESNVSFSMLAILRGLISGRRTSLAPLKASMSTRDDFRELLRVSSATIAVCGLRKSMLSLQTAGERRNAEPASRSK